jgi:RNA polymerase-interacting CarD/CdnL/TRCF family regulator
MGLFGDLFGGSKFDLGAMMNPLLSMKLQHFVAIPCEDNYWKHWFQFKTKEGKLEEFIVVYSVYPDRIIYHRTHWKRVGEDLEFRTLSERGPWSIPISFLQELGTKLPTNTQSPVGHPAAKVSNEIIVDPNWKPPREAAAPAPPPAAASPYKWEPVSTPKPAAATPPGLVTASQGFEIGEILYYRALGVGRIVGIEDDDVNGETIERFIIEFESDNMLLRVPTATLQELIKKRPLDFTDDGQDLDAEQDNDHGFAVNEFVVYPQHGVGQILAIEEQEIASARLELFVINFPADQMTLRVPTNKIATVGMRKLSDPDRVKVALETLSLRPQLYRGNWSEEALEYEDKINSGDIVKIAEVVRDLFSQFAQSHSKRGLYTAALDRFSREVALVANESESEVIGGIKLRLKRRTKSSMLAKDLAALRRSLQGGDWRVDGNNVWRVYEVSDQLQSGTKVLLKIQCSFSKELSGHLYNSVCFYLEPYLFFQPSQRPFENHLTKPPYSIGLIADGTGKGTEEDPVIIGGRLETLACSVGDEEETAMFNVSPKSMRTCLRALTAGSDLSFSINDHKSDPSIKLRLRLQNTREFSQLYDRVRRGI